jgi:hypothetical protein
MRSAWGLVAGASDVPAVWLRRLLRQVKEQARREHFRQTGHPLTRPYKERGMDWVWCYVDEALLDPI